MADVAKRPSRQSLGVLASLTSIQEREKNMKSTINPEGLTITDSPGCFWLFGLFFCIIGMAAIFAGLSTMHREIPMWQIAIVIFFGLASISAGMYVIYHSPVSRIVINNANKEILMSHRGLFRHEDQVLRLLDIQSVYILQGKDIDGGPVYTLRFHTNDGRELPVTHLWLHNRDNITGILNLLGNYVSVGNIQDKRK
jgi:hypothetical protein